MIVPKQNLHEHHIKNKDDTFSTKEDTTLSLSVSDMERKSRNLIRQKTSLLSDVDLLERQINDIKQTLGYNPKEPEEEDYTLEHKHNGGE